MPSFTDNEGFISFKKNKPPPKETAVSLTEKPCHPAYLIVRYYITK